MDDNQRDDVEFSGTAMLEDVKFTLDEADKEDLDAFHRAEEANARQSDGAGQLEFENESSAADFSPPKGPRHS